jgi:hypothetical protein
MGARTYAAWECKVLPNCETPALDANGSEGWQVVDSVSHSEGRCILMRPALTFQEQVTLDQRKRYFGTWGIDIDEVDRESIG